MVPDILCYFLCLTCVLLLLTLLVSFGQTLQENEWQQNGRQDVLFSYIESEEELSSLERDEVRRLGTIALWGSQDIPKAVFDGQLVFGTADETARDLLYLQLSAGGGAER